MYLSDRDLRAVLEDLSIQVDNVDHPFDAITAIQPCSIDMRVDRIFWKEKKGRRTVDLRRSLVQELDARRYWRRLELSADETLVLKPGEMILARVYESFRVPTGCAARIVPRSSFARMGLLVTVACDFINPGYSGHMPLQLVNLSSRPLKLAPYLPLCQLVVVRLSSDSEKNYGDEELKSKYTDDDGGPSYWWRDRSYLTFQKWLDGKNLSQQMRSELARNLRYREVAVMERFEAFLDKQRLDQVDNVADILLRFTESERKRKRVAMFLDATPKALGFVGLGTILTIVRVGQYSMLNVILLLLSVLAVGWGLWTWLMKDPPGEFYTSLNAEEAIEN